MSLRKAKSGGPRRVHDRALICNQHLIKTRGKETEGDSSLARDMKFAPQRLYLALDKPTSMPYGDVACGLYNCYNFFRPLLGTYVRSETMLHAYKIK